MEREVVWFTVCTSTAAGWRSGRSHWVQTQEAESDDRGLLSSGPAHVSAIDGVLVVLQMCYGVLSVRDMRADGHSSLICVGKKAILWSTEKPGVLLPNCYLVIESIFLCMARHKMDSK